MGVTHGFLFPKNQQSNSPEPPSDGILPSGELSTTGALGSESAHGDIGSYRTAQAASSNIGADAGSGGFGLGGAVDTSFSTTGEVAADSNDQSATAVAGTDPLVVRDELPSDSNWTAGGRTAG
jgi:hypothetical protein